MIRVGRLSVEYIRPKSRTERSRKTKIGTEVAHVTRDSDTTFKVTGRGHIEAASRLQIVIIKPGLDAADSDVIRDADPAGWAWLCPGGRLPTDEAQQGSVGVHRSDAETSHCHRGGRQRRVSNSCIYSAPVQ